ncbi:stalk domain-containing protein [Thermoanaerobacterium thermosaccharolyticum]|uniref:stalk domain-containing protein n=1 Tax=Thermoanaerobacterium thermosaccharolyticum TaxID=1517 RepID=UPI003DA98FBF
MYKKFLSVLLTVLLLLSFASPTQTYADNITIIINGQNVTFAQQPIIKNGTTLVPMRAFFEALGAKVDWDQSTRTVAGTRDNTTVQLTIGSKIGKVNGQNHALAVEAQIINGYTYIPLRFVGEALGDEVNYSDGVITINTNKAPPIGKLTVSYIDVGQGDSILIQTPSGKNMLIDAGVSEMGSTVVSYLKSKGINKLDVVIATHPHDDHIGGMPDVINTFNIGTFYMPKVTTNTNAFENLLNALKNKNVNSVYVKARNNINLDSDITAKFLAPNSSSYDNLNNYSAVIKLTYKNVSFLFTGDAEKESEQEMLNKGYNLKADVLKVGHHGSDTSTTADFLKAVSPKYAVISVGKNNDYGHPNQSVLDRLNNAGIKIFRTDLNGTVVATTDGNTITFNVNPTSTSSDSSSGSSNTEKVYVDANGHGLIKGNINSKGEKIYHLPGDPWYDRTKAEAWFKTEAEAQAAGYRPVK